MFEFTTDYARLLESMSTIKPGDTSSLEEGLSKVSSLVIDETAGFSLVQILLITDEFDNLRPTSSVRRLCEKLKTNRKLLQSAHVVTGLDFDERMLVNSILNDELINGTTGFYLSSFPFSFPNRFDIISLTSEASLPNVTKIEWESDQFK